MVIIIVMNDYDIIPVADPAADDMSNFELTWAS